MIGPVELSDESVLVQDGTAHKTSRGIYEIAGQLLTLKRNAR